MASGSMGPSSNNGKAVSPTPPQGEYDSPKPHSGTLVLGHSWVTVQCTSDPSWPADFRFHPSLSKAKGIVVQANRTLCG